MSLNCHCLVLFKSPRDSSQVNHLAKQMFPGHVKYMQESFQDATKRLLWVLVMRSETGNTRRLPFEDQHFPWRDSVRLCQKGIKRLHRSSTHNTTIKNIRYRNVRHFGE